MDSVSLGLLLLTTEIFIVIGGMLAVFGLAMTDDTDDLSFWGCVGRPSLVIIVYAILVSWLCIGLIHPWVIAWLQTR